MPKNNLVEFSYFCTECSVHLSVVSLKLCYLLTN